MNFLPNPHGLLVKTLWINCLNPMNKLPKPYGEFNPYPSSFLSHPSSLSPQPSTLNLQPSAISHQPSAISHQPSSFIPPHSSFLIPHSYFLIHTSSFILHYSPIALQIGGKAPLYGPLYRGPKRRGCCLRRRRPTILLCQNLYTFLLASDNRPWTRTSWRLSAVSMEGTRSLRGV